MQVVNSNDNFGISVSISNDGNRVIAGAQVVVVDIVVVVVVVGRLMKVVEVVVPITQVASIHQVLYVQSMPRVGM
jgi:hypothetical protein